MADALKKSPACLTGLCDSGNRQGELGGALFERQSMIAVDRQGAVHPAGGLGQRTGGIIAKKQKSGGGWASSRRRSPEPIFWLTPGRGGNQESDTLAAKG
jgi:hypothetical protein